VTNLHFNAHCREARIVAEQAFLDVRGLSNQPVEASQAVVAT